MWFLVEFLIWIGVFFILKKYWHMDKVQKHFIDFVISINIITCLMYMYLIYLEALSFSDGISKIFLHGVVALIVYTLTKNNTYKVKKDD